MAKSNDEIVFRPSGDSEWVIPPEITKVIPEFKGKIVCDAEAYEHIETRHGKQIRGFRYADAIAFLAYTLARASAVYEAKNDRGKTRHAYELVANVSTQGENLNRVIVYLAEFPERSFYDVSTAHVIHKHRYKNRTPLWVHTPCTLRAVTNLSLPQTGSAQPFQSG